MLSSSFHECPYEGLADPHEPIDVALDFIGGAKPSYVYWSGVHFCSAEDDVFSIFKTEI